MKKLFLLLVLAMSFMACEGPIGPMGPAGLDGMDGLDGRPGRDGQDGKDGQDGYGANWFSRSFTIYKNDWKLAGNPGELNSHYFVKRTVPELTQSIYEGKAVIAYIQNGTAKNGMPYVLHKGGVASDGTEFIWTQTYDFDYTEEEVCFYLTYNDFQTQVEPDDVLVFHIVLIW